MMTAWEVAAVTMDAFQRAISRVEGHSKAELDALLVKLNEERFMLLDMEEEEDTLNVLDSFIDFCERNRGEVS